ncbi:MAG: 4-(cytidine 5'-diphospho)-2-C-methyl-D-erythritol kinase [Prevotella sp.]|jgi:4-diphosphocytidyl-2-C-methyl-D-erythritol kinase|nr:4-(cytidine 5'-diphospho)-2-C-methyl-D-erythritol kinase [Prevotella sp.]
MICFPNAKINLGLNIVSRRNDGYHNLETIFYPIPVKDALEITVKKEQDADTFIEAGIRVDSSPESNLAMKALKLMRENYDFPFVEVYLLKKIPFGAGLGGGSADASFMLKLINKTFGSGATDEELASLAVRLGADCPFFIYNRPMFATGIGEIFEPVDFSLKGYSLVLIKPDIHVSTKDAFSLIKPTSPNISLKEIIKKPVQEWKGVMINDFEKSVFEKCLAIGSIKESLYRKGALYASMTGSGSSVFGIFDKYPEIDDIEYEGCYIWKGTLNT